MSRAVLGDSPRFHQQVCRRVWELPSWALHWTSLLLITMLQPYGCVTSIISVAPKTANRINTTFVISPYLSSCPQVSRLVAHTFWQSVNICWINGKKGLCLSNRRKLFKQSVDQYSWSSSPREKRYYLIGTVICSTFKHCIKIKRGHKHPISLMCSIQSSAVHRNRKWMVSAKCLR